MNRSKWKSVGDELFTNKLGVAALITLIVFTLGSIFAFYPDMIRMQWMFWHV